MSDTNTAEGGAPAQQGSPTEGAEAANDFESLIAELPDPTPDSNPLDEAPAAAPEGDTAEAKAEAPVEPEAPTGAPADTPETPAETTPDEPKLPAHLREMARKEQELFQREQLAKQQLQDAQALQSGFLEKLKKNPLETLKEQGLSYEDLTRQAVSDPSHQTSHQLETINNQIKQLMEQNQALQTQLQEQERARQDATYEHGVAAQLSAKKDDKGNSLFPLASAYWGGETGVAAQVRQRMEKVYTDSGGKEVISVTTAAQQLEEMLEKEIRSLPRWRVLEILEQKATDTGDKATGEPKGATKPNGGSATESLGNGPAGQTVNSNNTDDITFEQLLQEAEPFTMS